MEIQSLLNKLVQYSCNVFKDKLVGIYLHGSLAMGCFNPVKSDIDILIVIDDEITNMEKKNFMDFIIQLNDKLPSKGIELSIVKENTVKTLSIQHLMNCIFQICIYDGTGIIQLNILKK